MRFSPSRLRAALHADAGSEADAYAHQNIAADLAALMASSIGHWRALDARRDPPDRALLFAGLADVLSDGLDGISSAHLQALYAARSA